MKFVGCFFLLNMFFLHRQRVWRHGQKNGHLKFPIEFEHKDFRTHHFTEQHNYSVKNVKKFEVLANWPMCMCINNSLKF